MSCEVLEGYLEANGTVAWLTFAKPDAVASLFLNLKQLARLQKRITSLMEVRSERKWMRVRSRKHRAA